jgi:xanthine dehydrogenase accessory factor
MAVAILAELVQLRASGALAEPDQPARETGAGEPGPRALLQMAQSSPAPAAPAAAEAAEAVDPVCGMTVPADAAHWPLEHGGTTYYFCCAGCRSHYEKELVR